jgi:plasmid maintenance system antidote protein VapI
MLREEFLSGNDFRVTAKKAILLGELFGNSPEFWLGLQENFDVWRARRRHPR